jgi:hypothetical protein
MTARVQADAATAGGLGITGTPAFLVGVMEPDGRETWRYHDGTS